MHSCAQLGTALPSDLGDPALNSWILWWNTQALPFTERWWSPPMFYPVKDALARCDTAKPLPLFTKSSRFFLPVSDSVPLLL